MMMRRCAFAACLLVFAGMAAGEICSCELPDPFDADAEYAQIIHVSPGGDDALGTGSEEQPFRSLGRAARDAKSGSDILLHAGSYPPDSNIRGLQGTASRPIRIRGESRENPAVFSGGGVGFQLSDPRYLVLEDLEIEGASGNGINIDDGGNYETPAEHVILRRITVHDIGPTGNRDGVKLSGLDHFRVEDCTIRRPGDGGSAIDMVGCHDGILAHNRILDGQSTGIQAKGGSVRLLIYGNLFDQAGQRAVNMGGSTGMQFFRPLDAPYEASQIAVWANVFVGGVAPIAFVGCENGLFAQNTIYLPEKWAGRILQENNDGQLVQCRNNVYANNIVVFDERVGVTINIGPNTQPRTFVFANNLWMHQTNDRFSGPNLPVREADGVIQKDPLFADIVAGDFTLRPESPAIGAGGDLASIIGSLDIPIPAVGDYAERCWNRPPSIGAWEGNPAAKLQEWKRMD